MQKCVDLLFCSINVKTNCTPLYGNDLYCKYIIFQLQTLGTIRWQAVNYMSWKATLQFIKSIWNTYVRIFTRYSWYCSMIRYRISTIIYVHQIIIDKFYATMGCIITQLLFAAEKVYLCFFICQRDHSDFFNSITYINMNHLSSCIKVYTISLQELPYRVKYKHTLFII